MALKIKVEDRISTYPGRVKLTPVSGTSDTFDLTRADSPIVEGTPIDSMLFDNKAYTLTEDVTVYVSPYGNDLSGDGSYDAPFATIQKAVDSIPLHLGGHTARIDIENGTYEERVSVVGFSGGSLVVGVPGRDITLRGIEIIGSSHVTTNIANIIYIDGFTGPLYRVDKGSVVLIGSNMTMNGNKKSVIGVSASNGSNISTYNETELVVSDCYNAAVVAEFCSCITLYTVSGANNSMGLVSTRGSVLSYVNHTLDGAWGDVVSAGSIMVTGGNSSEFVDSTVI